MDKCNGKNGFNLLILLILCHFYIMRKKFVFSVVAKSRKNMVLHEASNAISVTLVVANF